MKLKLLNSFITFSTLFLSFNCSLFSFIPLLFCYFLFLLYNPDPYPHQYQYPYQYLYQYPYQCPYPNAGSRCFGPSVLQDLLPLGGIDTIIMNAIMFTTGKGDYDVMLYCACFTFNLLNVICHISIFKSFLLYSVVHHYLILYSFVHHSLILYSVVHHSLSVDCTLRSHQH